jgi:hypothetical protein
MKKKKNPIIKICDILSVNEKLKSVNSSEINKIRKLFNVSFNKHQCQISIERILSKQQRNFKIKEKFKQKSHQKKHCEN